MSYLWEDWDHITKIDPDRDLVDGEAFENVCETGTDALETGGTLDITEEKTERVIEVTSKYDVPIYQKPSNPDAVIDDDALDGYLIPTVFNANDSFWVIGAHKEWVHIEDGLGWDRTRTEAYIVLNPESSVAEYTDVDTDQPAEDAASFARATEKIFGQKIIYVEYSGTYGDPEKVGVVHGASDDATLFYGGGIHDYESTYEMGQYANAVVIGNLLHDEGVDAVRETVEGVEDAAAELVVE